MAASIVSGSEFTNANFIYTKAKLNSNGRKSIGILNSDNKKSLYLSTPLMLTWGVNEYVDEKSGNRTYDMALQFPNDEYANEDTMMFLKAMQNLEKKVKEDAVVNSKDWLNKVKLVPEAVDAVWTPMLKYPKNKETEEPDYSRAPTLKVKLNYWEDEFKLELYNEDKQLVYPNDTGVSVMDLITKASNVATVIQCGGIWVAGGKFGITWKLFQAVVKPKATLLGKCHITLTEKEKQVMSSQKEVDVEENVKTQVGDSDDDDDDVQDVSDTVVKEVKEEVREVVKEVVTEDTPKTKKRVIKKKVASDSS